MCPEQRSLQCRRPQPHSPPFPQASPWVSGGGASSGAPTARLSRWQGGTSLLCTMAFSKRGSSFCSFARAGLPSGGKTQRELHVSLQAPACRGSDCPSHPTQPVPSTHPPSHHGPGKGGVTRAQADRARSCIKHYKLTSLMSLSCKDSQFSENQFSFSKIHSVRIQFGITALQTISGSY